MIIQRRAKNRLWQAGRRWRVFTMPKYEELQWDVYDYILGDQIFTEDNEDAKKAYQTVVMWAELNGVWQ